MAGAGFYDHGDRRPEELLHERDRELLALKRRCTPEDVAEVVLFLCAGAAMITGQMVVVDGGSLL